jgi:hypothetical protein
VLNKRDFGAAPPRPARLEKKGPVARPRPFLLALACALAAALTALPARAAESVRVIAVGANHSFKASLPGLKFAERDAARFAAAMRTVGLVPETQVTFLSAPHIAELRRVLASVAQASDATAPSKLVFYFSGHAEESGLHVDDGMLSKGELHALLRSVHARTKIAIIDSCFAGDLAIKGARQAPAFDIPALTVDEPSGTVFLSASGKQPYAIESDTLEGSVFTHNLLSGLYGEADRDRDGIVTVDELYQYVYRATRQANLTYPGALRQDPSFASELSGRGAVALAYPARMHATLTLAADVAGEVTVSAREGLAFVRVDKLAGATKALRLPEGAYDVAVRDGARVGTRPVNLATASETRVAAADLRWQIALAGDVNGKGDGAPTDAAASEATAATVTAPTPARAHRAAVALGYGDFGIDGVSAGPGALADASLARFTPALDVRLALDWRRGERTQVRPGRFDALGATLGLGLARPFAFGRFGYDTSLGLGQAWIQADESKAYAPYARATFALTWRSVALVLGAHAVDFRKVEGDEREVDVGKFIGLGWNRAVGVAE